MKVIICAIYDKKGKNYEAPFTQPNKAIAVRSFMQACQDEKSPLNIFAEDFNLQEIGEFNTETGIFTPFTEILLEAANIAQRKNKSK